MSSPISGFTAVPNPIMLPFMAMQSYFMMLLAGEAWQYGKRKISAMTNEEFNQLDIQTHLSNLITSMEKAIPSIEQSMRAFTPLARTITAEMIKTLPEIAKGFGEGIAGISPTSGLSTQSNIMNVRLDAKGLMQQRGYDTPFGIEKLAKESQENIARYGSNISKYITGGYEKDLAKKKADAKAKVIAKGKAGLKISQKVQRIPFTYQQKKVFTLYKNWIEVINRARVIINKGGPTKYMNSQRGIIRGAEIRLKKYREQINRARSVNLKGFELYYKWLQTQ